MRKIALIPSLEPDNKLINLTEELHNNNFDIIVVNDGSSKEFDHIFNKAKKYACVLSYKTNKGKGYALKHGIKYIKENYKEPYIIITMDSDGQHKVDDAIKLCNYVINNPNELVIGKRIRSKKTPLRSRFGNAITKLVYFLTTKVNVYDTQTGLRSFTNHLVDFLLNVNGNRFEYEMNVLLLAPKENIKITEIEIETIYIDNNSKSHFNTFKDSLRVYKEILKFSLASILSFFLDFICYTVFIIISKNIVFSNITARIISATFNYIVNKKIVFKNTTNHRKSLPKYIILAVSILIINTVILKVLTLLGINALISKLIVELLLFIMSFIVQKKLIFINS